IGYEKLAGHAPSRATKTKLSTAVHIGYGLLVASLYNPLRGGRSRPILRAIGEGPAPRARPPRPRRQRLPPPPRPLRHPPAHPRPQAPPVARPPPRLRRRPRRHRQRPHQPPPPLVVVAQRLTARACSSACSRCRLATAARPSELLALTSAD